MFTATRLPQVTIERDNLSVAGLNVGTTPVSALLAVVLLISLAPLPHAAAFSNHTWRVELAAGMFLLLTLALGNITFALTSRLSTRVIASIGVFTLWSLMSAAWAISFASVLHHTLLWVEYALVFGFALEILRTRGRAFLLTTFVCFVAIIALVTFSDYLSMPDFKTVEGTLRLRYSAYGELAVTIVPLLWISAIYRRRTGGWLLCLVPAILGWTAAMLSLSKGVFIAGIAGFACTFAGAIIFGKSHHHKRLFATVGLWLIVTIAVQVGFSALTSIPATVDYISGKADETRETSIARVLIWRSTLPLIRDHWLLGVGADNFGIRSNEGRAEYRLTHPDDPKDEMISDFLWERAHNEPLQVLAELGVIGLLLFAVPFAIFIWAVARSIILGKKRPSLLFWAACGGMIAFAASAMVSSFALRIVPNGIAFFLVFAIALNELSRTRTSKKSDRSVTRLPRSVVAAVLFFVISVFAMKGLAEYYFAYADTSTDKAAALFSRAATLDPDYAAVHYRLSRLSFDRGDYQEAANQLRNAIDHGMGVVLTYSSLADSYEKAGDTTAEFQTFDEALGIFPRSAYLRVRYSIALDKEGDQEAAGNQLATARAIDVKQANGWRSLISRGSVKTFYDARDSDVMATPADLKPYVAVLQYLDKDPGK